jgi:hypothetical protein
MSNHKSHWDLNKERFVNRALEKYKNENCPSSGYDILRYAAMGVVTITEDVAAEEFMSWYPSHMGFVILRLAKAGKLVYKEN